MLNILIAEGTPAVWQAERAGSASIPTFRCLPRLSSCVTRGIRCTALNIADGEALPFGTALSDFDGVMVPRAYHSISMTRPPPLRGIHFCSGRLRLLACPSGELLGFAACHSGTRGIGTAEPRGRDLPIARAITVTEAGRAHPLLASRPAVFDALSSHLDEIETLPPN